MKIKTLVLVARFLNNTSLVIPPWSSLRALRKQSVAIHFFNLFESPRPRCGLAMTKWFRFGYLRFMPLIFSLLCCITKGAMALEGTQNFENYLNSLKTLSGDFIQINSHGQTSSGTIQISRPGKMRLTYNPPSPLLIVADGKWLVTKDRDADQVDYVSLENTPAAFILRPQIRFSGADMEVNNVVAKGKETEVSLVRTEDPDGGYITLVFQENPLILKEWRIVDAQGVETRVVLSNIKSNIPLPAQLFNIESPNIIQQIF